MSEQLVKASATWMAQAIHQREVSAVELFDAHAARIAERDPQVNALVLPRLDEARAEAVEADAALARGEHFGPLHGVALHGQGVRSRPAGMPSPNGSRLFADHVDDADAVPLRRLRDAGAILLGKTNVPEFCAHWDTYNELFGATGNPHDVTRSAGGSSGGEAAALASAMTALGLGSDYGGSIRCPAHFCGVFGLRPGRDTLPWADHHPMVNGPGPRMMATVGPLARSVDDLELALAVLGAAGAGGRRRRPASRSSRTTGCSRWPRPAARPCGARPRRWATPATTSSSRAARPGRGPRAFDTVLVHEAASRDARRTWTAARTSSRRRSARCSRRCAASSRRWRPTSRRSRGSWRSSARPTRGSSATAPPCARWRPTSRRRCAGASVPSTASPCAPAASSRCAPTPARSASRRVAVPVARTTAGLPVGVQLIGRRGHERALLALARELESAFGGWLDPDARLDRAVALDRPRGPREGRGVTDQPATQDRAAQPRRRRPDPGRRGQLRRHARPPAARDHAVPRAPPARLRQRGRS